ncbi:hypothetical protein [Arthrobacter sp. H14-L1]|uniref:hypothetical protein n=1 Tax=Arthrobacter sp. H14-L1 TaxID=2996697 RepID=UPI00226D72F5|nr:hypothetical protein [Arthrobacter sp. H14-L1]MCY0905217.1 hypothetical protein [Arthrobacter sp. H14-L1]
MSQHVFGIIEWIFWIVAIGSACLALFRAEVVSAGSSPGVRQRNGLLMGLWILAAVTGLLGLVTAALAMRASL